MTTKSDSYDENEDMNSETSGENSGAENEEEMGEHNSIDEENHAEDEKGDSNEENHDSDDDGPSRNLAWADSIAKILKTKPKVNQPLVLSKAKKLTEVKSKPKLAGFEVELSDGEVKEEVVEEDLTEKSGKAKPKRKRKRQMPDLRVKPNILEKDREKVLAKIATKGVVQLFNAVRTQQKDIKDKLRDAGPLEVKKTKVLKNIDKNTFLDVLMSEKSQNVEEVLQKSSKPTNNVQRTNDRDIKKGKVWDVLRDNFMMDCTLKDWDKEIEVESEIEME